MNKILIDLKKAINSIREFYYSVPSVIIENDKLIIDYEEIKCYERRFVAEIKSEYDKIISNKEREFYKNVNTDVEVIKKFIFTDNVDNNIIDTYKKLNEKNEPAVFNSITTIPDFFIHKKQDDHNEIYQKLVIEVKTKANINKNDFFFDLFKLNIYVEKSNFKNAVFLLVNNDLKRIEFLVKEYLNNGFYISPINKDKIYFYIKFNFNAKLKIIKFIDILNKN